MGPALGTEFAKRFSTMILYDYHCPACGAVREVRHSIKESPAVACHACGGPMARGIPDSPSFTVKGGTVKGSIQREHDRREGGEVRSAKELVAELGSWREARKSELGPDIAARKPRKLDE
ncbi:MAG: zinc ribbon domain-containing protein [Candidatus Sumerlaeia bacterium]|nr:zinc ribbon domain-containing protein [Candidatus Sumerlaeia bacterium]